MSVGDDGSWPVAFLQKVFPSMRFPGLFALLAALLAVDLLVPDPVPIVDELVLAVLTLLAGSLRRRPPPE